MNPFIARKFFIPGMYKYWKTPVFKYFDEYMAHDRYSCDDLKRFQNKKLSSILSYAAENISYYRSITNLEKRGFYGESPTEKLNHFPVLTKKIIQEQGMAMFSKDFSSGEYSTEHSGGSTGQPTAVRKDLQTRAAVHAATWRANSWTGWQMGDPWVWLWGRLETTESSWRQKCVSAYKHFMMNEGFFNIHGLNKDRLRAFFKLYNKMKPGILIGYTNALYHLSLLAKDEKLNIYSPQGIVTTAETLFEDQRQLIESVFRCKIFNRYGSSEVGVIASECSAHSGFHIAVENVYIECLQENGEPCRDGEIGRIIVTDLNNRAMPLIRYDLGDMGTISTEPCVCKRPYPRLMKISGRLSDILKLPDGRIVFPDDLAEIFYPIPDLKKFQVIQETHHKINVNIVMKNRNENILDDIYKKLKTVLNNGVDVQLVVVEDIPVLPSGKHRICISRIKG